MTLQVDHPEATNLVNELIRYTGETASQAVLNALKERLNREKEKQEQSIATTLSLKNQLLQIGQECASLPLLDERPMDTIIGYDEMGLAS